MLESQFIYRLLLIITFGTFYVKSMQRIALYNNAETQNEKHTMLKILGVFFSCICVALIFMSFKFLAKVQYPARVIEFSANASWHPSSSHIVWGYPTEGQYDVIYAFINVYVSLGLATYCFFFKSSHSTVSKKILKVVANLLFFGLFFSASEFHYFDVYEWVIPCLFVLCVWFIDKMYDTSVKTQSKVTASANAEHPSTTMANADAEDTLLQHAHDADAQGSNSESTETIEDVQTEIAETEEHQNEVTADGRFCRHCGKRIEQDDALYCKHCGASLK